MTRFASALVLVLMLALPAAAQRYTQDARATVPLPSVLGAGNTGAAVPSALGAFFLNPAHIARLDLARPRVTFGGGRAQLTPRVLDQIDFALGDLADALDVGLDVLADTDTDGDGTSDLRELYDRGLEVGRKPGVARLGADLPAVQFATGGLGFGLGAFGNAVGRVRVLPGGAGVPRLDAYAQADAMVVVTVGGVVPGLAPGRGLAAGAALKYVRRYLLYKEKSVDAFSEREAVGVFRGGTVTVDLGLHHADLAPELPGALALGIAFYDVLGGAFDYALDTTYGDGAALSDEERQRVLDAFDGRDGDLSYRMGLTYTLPPFPDAPALSDLAVSVDHVSASTSEYEQPALARFSVGVRAGLGEQWTLRAGMSQGYASAGVGWRTRFAEVDYAFFGVENGRLPGQSERYNHLVQVRFGWR